MKIVENLLKNSEWPKDLEPGVVYERQHDDTTGGMEGHLMVQFTNDGDAFLSIDCCKTVCFKNRIGEKSSPNIHAALLVLARAIQLDNKEAE